MMAGTPETILPRTTNGGPPSVPRRAVFDDLRIGQTVAWLAGERDPEVIGGVVQGRTDSTLTFHGTDGTPWFVPRSHVERGEVTILRDAPASPVIVRREDYDALVDWHDPSSCPFTPRNRSGASGCPICDLIDNATTEEP